MHAHRVHILNRADDDAIVRLVADHLHLIFLPAEQAFVDQHLRVGRRIKAGANDGFIFFAVVSDAAACAAERVGGADNGGQAHFIQYLHSLCNTGRTVIADGLAGFVLDLRRRNDGGAGVFQADAVHRFAEEGAVFGHFNRVAIGTDQFHTEFFQRAIFSERERCVEGRLSTHGGEERVGPFFLDDLCHKFRCDRLHIGGVRQIRVGHDGGGVRVHQNDPVAFRFQRLTGLRAGIVEFTGLTDNDGARADDEDRFNVCTFWHGLALRLRDQRDKPVKEIVTVLRAGARLRVILHREDGLAFQPQPTICAVKEGDMGLFHIVWQAVSIHGEAMVHGGDLDLVGREVLHRVVGAVVALMHFFGLSPECECQHLMTQADAEDGFARCNELFDFRHGIGAGGGRVPRTV